MRDAPHARDLIETAREALKAELLPLLSGDDKYTGAMIANAIGIGLRELDLSDGAEAERRALQGLTGSDETDVGALNGRLAARIRDGAFDPGSDGHAAMRRALLSMTVERLALVNPKALEAERDLGTIPEGFEPWRQD